MIRKYKIYIIMGITVLLLFMVLPVDTKGDWEIPWDITLEGEGNDPAFRSSTVMEIFLGYAHVHRHAFMGSKG